MSDPVDRPILIQYHPCPECQGWDVKGCASSNHTRSCNRRPARWSDVDDLTGRDRRVAAQALRDAARAASGRWNVKPYVDQWLIARADAVEAGEVGP